MSKEHKHVDDCDCDHHHHEKENLKSHHCPSEKFVEDLLKNLEEEMKEN